eukprot:1728616-Amphidinium_carterae.1
MTRRAADMTVSIALENVATRCPLCVNVVEKRNLIQHGRATIAQQHVMFLSVSVGCRHVITLDGQKIQNPMLSTEPRRDTTWKGQVATLGKPS